MILFLKVTGLVLTLALSKPNEGILIISGGRGFAINVMKNMNTALVFQSLILEELNLTITLNYIVLMMFLSFGRTLTP